MFLSYVLIVLYIHQSPAVLGCDKCWQKAVWIIHSFLKLQPLGIITESWELGDSRAKTSLARLGSRFAFSVKKVVFLHILPWGNEQVSGT